MKFFNTPNQFDMRSITVIGLSAKVTDDPIGMFGSGLNFAVAVALRSGHTFNIRADEDIHVFSTGDIEFREQDKSIVQCSTNGKPPVDMPFTTNCGAHWKQWMAYRELIANTLDESGTEDKEDLNQRCCMWTDAFDNVVTPYLDTTPFLTIDDVELHMGESDYMYYKGFRVKSEVYSSYTWNIKRGLALTEDRTLENLYTVTNKISRFMEKCEDKDIVESCILYNSEHKKRFEQKLSLHELTPSLRKIAKPHLNDYKLLRSGIRKLFVDNTKKVLEMSAAQIGSLAKAVEFCPIPITHSINPVQNLGDGVCGLAEKDEIYISELAFSMGCRKVCQVLYEEELHLTQGFYDGTREMQNYLISQIITMQEEIKGDFCG